MKSIKILPALFFISFGVWFYCFRGFLSGELTLTSDAVSYYNHIKFFIDSLGKGIYPLWDPNWNGGVPNEFFLRRLGSFNPFYFLLLIMVKCGISYQFAYLYFFSFYWILGTIGFYKLAQCIFKNQTFAFVAYLLLLFSSLGTRIFDSYIILVFVPMVWSFYFLVDFTTRPSKHCLLGLTFCLMILLTTYIPLYFAIIFLVFLIVFIPMYFHELKKIIGRVRGFLWDHKILTLLCVILILISCLPGLKIFLAAKNTEFVLPNRGYGAESENILEVAKKTITHWAIVEELVYASAFENLKNFKFAIIYLPGFAFLIFFLGLFTKIHKRQLFLFVWAAILFLMGSPDLSPLYQYFYENVFFFKYFRNLHFFLWLALLPLFIIFLVEQLRQVLASIGPHQARRTISLIYIFIVHCIFLISLLLQGQAIISTYLVIVFSLLFFFLYSFGWIHPKESILQMIFLALLTLQPLEVYNYLNQNAEKYYVAYEYDGIDLGFSYTKHEEIMDPREAPKEIPVLYYSSKWHYFLRSNININVFYNYLRYQFIVVDHLKPLEDTLDSLNIVEKGFLFDANLGFISKDSIFPPLEKPLDAQRESLKISNDSENFTFLSYNPNSVEFKTNFPTDKYLIYNDSHHSQWRALVNGKKTDIGRANIAFKGIYLPAGENIVSLKYGSPSMYVFNYLLMGLFYSVFIYLLWLYYKENKMADLKNV